MQIPGSAVMAFIVFGIAFVAWCVREFRGVRWD